MRPTPDEIEASVWWAWSCAALFVAGYTLRFSWWRRVESSALAVHGFAFLLLVTPFVMRYAFGVNLTHVWYSWYYIGSFFAAGCVELWRLWVVWRR
jgi:hypothetical protein